MYNRYIPDGTAYTRIPEEETSPTAASAAETTAKATDKKAEHASGLTALLKKLKLDRLDTGDVLLLLIILFLFLEGDDLELIITLGLLLVMGLE